MHNLKKLIRTLIKEEGVFSSPKEPDLSGVEKLKDQKKTDLYKDDELVPHLDMSTQTNDKLPSRGDQGFKRVGIPTSLDPFIRDVY